MQLLPACQSFDGRDLVTLDLHGERQARVDALAVDQHGAGSALTVVAAFLSAGQPDVVAPGVQERAARLQLSAVTRAVDL